MVGVGGRKFGRKGFIQADDVNIIIAFGASL
jgi:hypothetical protein